MSPEKMVMMANQIATFFRSQPGTDQADRVAAHLKDYWEPRMRQQPHIGNSGELLRRDAHEVRMRVADDAAQGADADPGLHGREHIRLR